MKLVISLSLLALIVTIGCTRSHLPDERYSREDPRWKDYELEYGGFIGVRPDIFTWMNAGSQLLVLRATVLKYYNVKCDNRICNPIYLNELVRECVVSEGAFGCDQLDVMKEAVQYFKPQDIKWDVVNQYLDVDSFIYFVSHPVKDNVIGFIYEMDMNAKTFKYYDDLGNLGDAKFDDVEYIHIFTINVSSALKFLE
jgi:hypothetical protein